MPNHKTEETKAMLGHNKIGPATKERQTMLTRPKKAQRPFLTSSQLSDLFCRLDRNGDGELDLDEFTGIVRMLKLDVNEDFIAKVFKAVDADNTGTIEMQEFICAYQKIYCQHDASRGGVVAKNGSDEFIKATRYGTNYDGDRIFEVYLLSNDPKSGPNKKTTFNFKCGGNDTTYLSEYFHNSTTVDFHGTMEDITKMITADNKENYDTDGGARILWWVDIAMKQVQRSKVSKFVDIFGLPNNSKFLSSFSNFGSSLPKDPKSRVFMGNGVTVAGNVSSYSVFAQAVTLLDTPVVHHLPSWLENKIVSTSPTSFLSLLANYYTTRFAFLLNFSMLSDSRKNEQAGSFESAAGIAERFCGDQGNDDHDHDREDHSRTSADEVLEDAVRSQLSNSRNSAGVTVGSSLSNVEEEVEGDCDDSNKGATDGVETETETDDRESDKKDGVKTDSILTAEPVIPTTPPRTYTPPASTQQQQASGVKSPGGRFLSSYMSGKRSVGGDVFSLLGSRGKPMPVSKKVRHITPPTWTLSNSQLAKRPPIIKLDTVSMHILDNQGLGSNCLVTIRKLDEESSKFTSLEAKSRSGIVGRIFDGVWMKLLQVIGAGGSADVGGELDDSPATLLSFMDVLIHSYSMRSLGTIDYWMSIIEREVQDVVVSKHTGHLKQMERIIRECHNYVEPFLNIHLEFISEWEAEQTRIAEAEANMTSPTAGGGAKRRLSRQNGQRRSSTAAGIRHMAQDSGSTRSNMGAAEPPGFPVMEAVPTFIEGIENLPLSYKLMRRFYNANVHRDLKIVTDGYELLDMKGLVYWKERLDRYAQHLCDIRELVSIQLDEKRNFTSFTLTIVTTLLAPLAILTGYFGMNFENMNELDHTHYSYAPGVYLMWYITAIAYGVMVLLAFHFRIIYSAT